MDLFSYQPARVYPNVPGYRDDDTSRQAAESVKDRSSQLRDRCLRMVRQAPRGCTADETAAALNETVLSIRPRFTELLRLGHIRDSGHRRRNESGRSAKVWVAV